MTDIEQKALALLNEARSERGYAPIDHLYRTNPDSEALCRAIEQHEAFRQEVHDAVWDYIRPYKVPKVFWPIIIWEPTPEPKPDPLVDVLTALDVNNAPEDVDKFRAALDALGFEIREKNDGQPNSN